MNKMLGILGVGLVAGVVIYVLCNKNKEENETKLEKETSNIKMKLDDVAAIKADASMMETIFGENQDKLQHVKNSSANKIMTRHEEAAKIMKETVSHIDARKEVLENENLKLEQISDELDELLEGK